MEATEQDGPVKHEDTDSPVKVLKNTQAQLIEVPIVFVLVLYVHTLGTYMYLFSPFLYLIGAYVLSNRDIHVRTYILYILYTVLVYVHTVGVICLYTLCTVRMYCVYCVRCV